VRYGRLWHGVAAAGSLVVVSLLLAAASHNDGRLGLGVAAFVLA
jgi:hypothetical protein